MNHEHRNLRSSGNQRQELKTPFDDYVSPVNDWCLRLAVLLVLASVLILVTLALLPSVLSAREATIVTISPRQAQYQPGVDPSVVFDLERNGISEMGLTVTVSVSQTGPAPHATPEPGTSTLPRGDRSASLRTVTFSPRALTAELAVAESELQNMPSDLEVLQATLEQGNGYIPGSPRSARVRIGSRNPQVTVQLVQDRYLFDEGVEGNEVAFIARRAFGRTPPARAFSVLLESSALPGEAKPDTDYRPLATVISVEPDDFQRVAGSWVARETVALEIFSDAIPEAEEAFTVTLRPGPDDTAGNQQRLRFVQPDGRTPCGANGCRAEVIIRGGICNRTAGVQHAILNRLQNAVQPQYRGDCRGVSGEWLAKLNSLNLDFPHQQVDGVRPGDFAGLSDITELHISGQPQLQSLPTGAFEGLSRLESLWIHHNPSLTTLAEGVFYGLDRLRVLGLSHNRLKNFEPGAFVGLASLETLILRHNQLQSFPFDEFEALPDLQNLFLSENPGYRWSIEVSDATLKVTPGQPAAYRLRLTAQPCAGGAEIAVRWHSLGWGVGIKSDVLRFTQDDWFRSREIQIVTSVDTPPQARLVGHETRNGCYRQQMEDLPPTVAVSVASPPTRGSPGTPDEVQAGNHEHAAVSLSVAPDDPADNRKKTGVSVLGGAWTLSGNGGATIKYSFSPLASLSRVATGEKGTVNKAPQTAEASLPSPAYVAEAPQARRDGIVNLRASPGAWLTGIPRMLASTVIAVGRRLQDFGESHATMSTLPQWLPRPADCGRDSPKWCVF